MPDDQSKTTRHVTDARAPTPYTSGSPFGRVLWVRGVDYSDGTTGHQVSWDREKWVNV